MVEFSKYTELRNLCEISMRGIVYDKFFNEGLVKALLREPMNHYWMILFSRNIIATWACAATYIRTYIYKLNAVF